MLDYKPELRPVQNWGFDVGTWTIGIELGSGVFGQKANNGVPNPNFRLSLSAYFDTGILGLSD